MNRKISSALSAFILGLVLIFTSQVNAAPAQLKRLWGRDRYQTCSEIVKEGWKSSDYAVVASGEGFADALCAAPLAKKYNAPIVLTGKTSLNENTKAQLKSLKVKNVLIVGGIGVVSTEVENEIKALNIKVERISGLNRYETSVAVAKKVGTASKEIILTNGLGYADALSVAPIAAYKGAPILLTEKDNLPAKVEAFLKENEYNKSYVVLGGTGVVSDNVASKLKNHTRLWGSDRYSTNAAILNHFAKEFDSKKAYIASGTNYPDALSGSVLAAANKAPLILMSDTVEPSVMKFAKNRHYKAENITVLGGESVLKDSLVQTIINNEVKVGDVKVHYIDVGQADSILIQTPNGKNMLIDAGNNGDDKKVISYLKNLGITQLDIVAGTHPHEDHIGGLDSVINMFKVGKVYMPKATSNTKTFKDVITAIKNKGLTITTPVAGTTVDLHSNVKLEILAPNSEKYKGTANNYSIVFKLTYGEKSFLFTGDAEGVSEQEILKKGYNLKSDVLKVGHHGSDTSTTDVFLKAVAPEYAVISVGTGNSYGHPTKATIDKLKNAGTKIYRTDEKGTVVATCDGSSIKFNTEK